MRRQRLRLENPLQFQAECAVNADAHARRRQRMRAENSYELDAQRARNADAQARRRQHMRAENPSRLDAERAQDANSHARRRQRMRAAISSEQDAERARNADSQSRRRQRMRANEPHRLSARGCMNLPSPFTLGAMGYSCLRCEALHFQQEQTGRHRRVYSTCCRKGKVRLAPMREMPPHLAILFPRATGVDEDVRAHHLLPPTLASVPLPELQRKFMEAVRHYNGAMAFASVSAEVDVLRGRGPPSYRIHGQVYHFLGSPVPDPERPPAFAQLYFIDTEEAVRHQMSGMGEDNGGWQLNMDIMRHLQGIIREVNPYAQLYVQMREVVAEYERRGTRVPNLEIAFANSGECRVRNESVPTAAEVAAVFPEGHLEDRPNEFVVHVRGREPGGRGGLKRLPATHAAVDPLCYPLLFPYGDPGWHTQLRSLASVDDSENGTCEGIVMRSSVAREEHNGDEEQMGQGRGGRGEHDERVDAWEEEHQDEQEGGDCEVQREEGQHALKQKVTMREFYAYRIAQRPVHNPLLFVGRLFQQYLVDAYVRIERTRLDFQRNNQQLLRADTYRGLTDFVANEAHYRNITPGRVFVLPSTFIGGPRHMNELYMDAMAICRRFGAPDLFVTVTCNPQWPEINAQLGVGQGPSDRPDLVATVFKLKLDEFFEDVLKRHVLGKVVAYTSVIEFQKRGLPHCHVLLVFDPADKPRDLDAIDSIASAEIPNPVAFPELHNKVTKFMIHGPCGAANMHAPCMADGQPGTVCIRNFPKLLCGETRVSGNSFPTYRRRNMYRTLKRGTIVDDRWVVPYNPYLLCRYDAHINVEICASVKAYKYIFKYIFKGPDRIVIHARTTAEGGREEVLHLDEIEAYVKSRYISASEAVWRLREYALSRRSHAVVRLAVHLENEQTVVFHPVEEEAALERGGLDTTLTAWFKLNMSDVHARAIPYADIPEHYVFDKRLRRWKRRAREGSDRAPIGRMYSVNPRDRERFFLHLLLLYTPGAISYADLRTIDGHECRTFQEACEVRELTSTDDEWEKCLREAAQWAMPGQLRSLFAMLVIWCCVVNVERLFETFRQALSEDYVEIPDVAAARAYDDIDCMLVQQGHPGLADLGVVRPMDQEPSHADDRLMGVQMSVDERSRAALNSDQMRIHDEVVNAATSTLARGCFFVDGPGGTEKTLLYNVIVNSLKGLHRTVVCVAWTGIAAMLLPGGATAHSTFKIPLDLDASSVLCLRGQSPEAHKLRAADVIIWDEAPMAPANALDAVDRGLRTLMRNDLPFGGKVMVLGGDFRQVLPVIPRGSMSEQMAASIKSSNVWWRFQVRHLTQNMRTSEDQVEFARWLLRIGDGVLVPDVELPRECIVHGDLADAVFGAGMQEGRTSHFHSTVILAPTNTDCDAINANVNERICGEAIEYKSIDTMDDEGSHALYPVEFLNTLNVTGIPPHVLRLRMGSIVLLLRNLNLKRGLCNGVRMVVCKMEQHVLEVELLTGPFAGSREFIPRIEHRPALSQMPINFVRKQFPVQLAFAMTINKAQGQTFDKLGLWLERPVFTHGQLYVALSRVCSKGSLFVKLPNGMTSTRNVVGPSWENNIR